MSGNYKLNLYTNEKVRCNIIKILPSYIGSKSRQI